MRTRWFVGLPLLLLLVVAAGIWAANSWLESPAGRARLETALADAVNMPVRLGGDFSVSFWPAVGISGRNLEIGGFRNHSADGPITDAPLLRCDSFHVSVALWPLVQGRLIVLAVRAADGKIDPSRMNEKTPESSGESSPPVRLPQVNVLRLENFQIPLDGTGDTLLQVHLLEVNDFRVGADTSLELAFSITRSAESLARIEIESRFRLDADISELIVEIDRLDLQSAGWGIKEGQGTLHWNRVQDEITLALAGLEQTFGKLKLSGAASPGILNGRLAMEVFPLERDEALAVGVSFQPIPGGVELDEVRIDFTDQLIKGHGCFLTVDEPALHLELEAATIDIDRLQAWLPAGGGSGADLDMTQLDLPLDLNIQLAVDEVRSGGVVAHEVSLATGGQPDCPGRSE